MSKRVSPDTEPKSSTKRSRTASQRRKAKITPSEMLAHHYQTNQSVLVRDVNIIVTFYLSDRSEDASKRDCKLEEVLVLLSNLKLKVDTKDGVKSEISEAEQLLRNLVLRDEEKVVTTKKEVSYCWKTTLSKFFQTVPKESYLMELLFFHSGRHQELRGKLESLSELNENLYCMSGGRYDFAKFDREWNAAKIRGGISYKAVGGFGIDLNAQMAEEMYTHRTKEREDKASQYYNIREMDGVFPYNLGTEDAVRGTLYKDRLTQEMKRTFFVEKEEIKALESEITFKKLDDGRNEVTYSETRHLRVNLASMVGSDFEFKAETARYLIQCLESKTHCGKTKPKEIGSGGRDWSKDCLTDCALLMSSLGLFPNPWSSTNKGQF